MCRLADCCPSRTRARRPYTGPVRMSFGDVLPERRAIGFHFTGMDRSERGIAPRGRSATSGSRPAVPTSTSSAQMLVAQLQLQLADGTPSSTGSSTSRAWLCSPQGRPAPPLALQPAHRSDATTSTFYARDRSSVVAADASWISESTLPAIYAYAPCSDVSHVGSPKQRQ